jgi:sulfur-oxidizing protein SoxX
MFSARQAVAASLFGLGVLSGPAPGFADEVQRGRQIFADRKVSMCVLCHPDPAAGLEPQANLGPSLTGIGARLNAAALAERIKSPDTFNPATIMPRYGHQSGLKHVAPAFAGKPILTSAQIDDVVAYLLSLKSP